MTLIRGRDSRVLVIIRETPHKMSCYNQLPENDQKACKKSFHKTYYAQNREQILASKKISCRERRNSQNPSKKMVSN